jgi:hypothetical protein
MKTPKLVGREFKSWDWYGWLMSIIGVLVICLIGKNDGIVLYQKICLVAVVSYITMGYFYRVAYGKIYMLVYYDTIIHKMYQVKILEETYYICADDEQDLDLYIELHYSNIKNSYDILGEHNVESFIKVNCYQ